MIDICALSNCSHWARKTWNNSKITLIVCIKFGYMSTIVDGCFQISEFSRVGIKLKCISKFHAGISPARNMKR
jgi:hypothetical protein